VHLSSLSPFGSPATLSTPGTRDVGPLALRPRLSTGVRFRLVARASVKRRTKDTPTMGVFTPPDPQDDLSFRKCPRVSYGVDAEHAVVTSRGAVRVGPDGSVTLTILTDVLEIEAFGEIVVYLGRSKLPLAP